MVPYDLSSFFLGEPRPGDEIFVHTATRKLTLEGFFGQAGVNPVKEASAQLQLNGTGVKAKAMTVDENGIVEFDIPTPYILNPGDTFKLVANVDVDRIENINGQMVELQSVSNLAVGIRGTSEGEDAEYYDMSAFSPGRIQHGQYMMMCLAPRSCVITDSIVSLEKDPVAAPHSFGVQLNGEPAGSLVIEPGKYTLLLNGGSLEVSEGDLVTVRAGEAQNGYIDEQMSGLFLSLIGEMV